MATAQLGTLLRHLQFVGAQRVGEATDRRLLDDFALRRDQAAFAALVSRHGPMVLRVCRRVLGHEQDAEDAFQATFLVLARNSTAIRKREALASWLHGVAYRVAMKARRSAARRRNHEARLRQVATRAEPAPRWDDVQAVLDEEVQRLSPRLREAFVVCVLEGKTGPEAAAALGHKEGTIKSRVSRARLLLQRRLAQRGIKLAALLAAQAVVQSARGALLPGALAHGIVCSCLGAAGATPAEVVPTHVAELAAGATRALFTKKARVVLAVFLATTILATGAGVLAHQALAIREQPSAGPAPMAPPLAAVKAVARPPAEEDEGTITYQGRVLGPDGRPVAGARLHVAPAWDGLEEPFHSPPRGTTGTDGRFAVSVSREKFAEQWVTVLAAADNLGPGWVEVAPDGLRDGLTVRLVADDVPIMGQVVNLEGQPVAGATLRVLEIRAAPGEDLGPWLDAVKDKKARSFPLLHQHVSCHTVALPLQATTGADGRFRLTGIGRNRVVRAQLDGATIASQGLHMLTRRGKALEVTEQEGNPEYGEPRTVTVYHGADFRCVAAPTKPVVGVVRDRDTKKPLPGVTVRSYVRAVSPGHYRGVDLVQATTDAEGRFRLVGLPKGEGQKIAAVPPGDVPYPAINREVPDSPGLAPVTVDFEMRRGVWIEGKITDKVTGKPVQAAVEYFSLFKNPSLGDYPGFDGTFLHVGRGVGTKKDGSYRLVGLPGPGLVAAWYVDGYLRAPDRNDEYGIKEGWLSTAPYHLHHPVNFGALARIDPPRGAERYERDVTFDPGWTFTVNVLGPDGKPLAGARAFGATAQRWDVLKTAQLKVQGYNPRQRREVIVQHLDKGLVGLVPPPRDNGGKVTVPMAPGATLTGRLVDASGQPRPGVALTLDPSWLRTAPGPVTTDRKGLFRIELLPEGQEVKLFDGKGAIPIGRAPGSGKTKEVGDVRLPESK